MVGISAFLYMGRKAGDNAKYGGIGEDHKLAIYKDPWVYSSKTTKPKKTVLYPSDDQSDLIYVRI